MGGSCDDVYFDSERKRIYAIGGEGFISAIQQKDPNHYNAKRIIPTTVGVRTGVFFGTSLCVGVPAAGLELVQIWNYGVRKGFLRESAPFAGARPCWSR